MLVVGMGLLLVAAGVWMSAVLNARLLHEFDQVLMAKAKALISLTDEDKGVIEFDFVDQLMPEFARAEHPDYFALWLASGTLLAKSPSLGEHDLRRLPGLDPTPVLRDTILPDGVSGRLVQIAFVPQRDADEDAPAAGANTGAAKPDAAAEKDKAEEADDAAESVGLDPRQFPDRAAVIIVARSREQLDALSRSVHLALGSGIAVLLIIMVVLVRLALRVGLRPLDDMQHQVAELDAETLTAGVEVHTQTKELMPMVQQLNAMLRRLDAAFARERQFSSDVAHELRTPLAELRMLTEVGGRWPDDHKAVRQYFADAHAICEQMEGVVFSLLTLTRCERGVQPVQRTALNLLELIEASWLSVEHAARGKSHVFECEVSPEIVIQSDHDILLMMLRNLLENAVFHSPPNSTICCRATQDGAKLQLRISNPAADLSTEDVCHIFERFWRKDAARSDGSHAGLGLAVVKAFSDLLGLDVQAQVSQHRMFAITLFLEFR
jgi:signal transduction histidine kinase